MSKAVIEVPDAAIFWRREPIRDEPYPVIDISTVGCVSWKAALSEAARIVDPTLDWFEVEEGAEDEDDGCEELLARRRTVAGELFEEVMLVNARYDLYERTYRRKE
jgi:hypothetical protein